MGHWGLGFRVQKYRSSGILGRRFGDFGFREVRRGTAGVAWI